MTVAVERGRAIDVRSLAMRDVTLAGEEVHALARVSFDVAGGAFVSVVGPSVGGKSSLPETPAGLLRPSEQPPFPGANERRAR